MQQQLKPHLCVMSGPVAKRDRVIGALGAEGLAAFEVTDHGLPSHPDPISAAAAGAPNSGHTPGTAHPELLDFVVQAGEHKADESHPCTDHDCPCVGEIEPRPNPLEKHIGSEYEDDPSIVFLAVEHDDPDRIVKILDDSGWMLRMFVAPVLQNLEEMISPEERIERIEQDMAILKGLR